MRTEKNKRKLKYELMGSVAEFHFKCESDKEAAAWPVELLQRQHFCAAQYQLMNKILSTLPNAIF